MDFDQKILEVAIIISSSDILIKAQVGDTPNEYYGGIHHPQHNNSRQNQEHWVS